MKLFTYKAMDKSGSVIIDTINAKNINEVENEIEKRKLITIKISERKKISTIFSNKKMAYLVPVFILGLSDVFLGFHLISLFVVFHHNFVQLLIL